jgi:hypothetical protein
MRFKDAKCLALIARRTHQRSLQDAEYAGIAAPQLEGYEGI